MFKFFISLTVLCSPVFAESLTATRVIRAQTILSESDVTLVGNNIPGALRSIDEALGLEARVTLYPGRAIMESDLGPPALVDRNQIVTVTYNAGTLGITTEGRSLARGGAGDMIRVMNLSSRTILIGRIGENGVVHVGQTP